MVDKQIEELGKLEQDSRKILDQTIITLSSSFIALILGFFKDISLYIQYSSWLKCIFLSLILFFILAITINLYSQSYSANTFRELQSCLLGEKTYPEKYFIKKHRNINFLNKAHFSSFILALISVFIIISISIFN